MTSQVSKVASTDLDQGRLDELARLARSSREGVNGLLALLEERSWSVRRAVIATLAALGEIALQALCRSLETERHSETRIAATVDTLVASEGDVERALSSLASSANAAVVADVAQILGRRRNPHSVPTLIGFLNHSDDNVAVAAIEALGRVGGRAAVDALVEIVERDYFFRTYPAIDVLGRSGDPRSVAPLARLLRKSQYLLEAARALGRTADKSAVQPLSELLVSPIDGNVRVAASALAELIEAHRALYGESTSLRDSVRQHATEASVRRLSQALAGADTAERIAMCVVLGASQNEAAAPALARMLDGVSAVASVAADALKQLGRVADEPLRAALLEGDSARRQILLPLFPSSGGTAEVLRCLEDADPAVRALACDTLARIGDASVVAALFQHLNEANPRVVQAAIGAIQSLGSNESRTLAIEAARATSPGTRRAALRILSYFGDAAAIDVFVEAIADADARVRDVAIAGLAFIEHPRARALLLRAAQDATAQVRTVAMRGLGQSTADADVIAALRRGLDDADAWVRYYACQALGKLGVQDAASALAERLADSAGQVRVAAVEALSHLVCAPALDALRSAAASEEPDVRRAALIGLGMMQSAESLPVLIAACTATEPATRLVALSALSTFGLPQTLPVVAHAMSDEDEGVRVAAIGFLASWPSAEATRLLIDAMRSEPLRARVIQALATPVQGRIAGLLHALASADDELAPALTSVLGRVDPGDESAALFEALRLPNVAARKAAAAMLAARGGREAFAALARQAAEDPSDEVRRVCALFLTQ
jgi:HEAT repeat protein